LTKTAIHGIGLSDFVDERITTVNPRSTSTVTGEARVSMNVQPG
jgi:hypothetical protein